MKTFNEIFQQGTGVIFDMDGTIIDSMNLHLRVWQEIAAKYGRKISLKQAGEMAKGINSEILERIFPGQLSDAEIEKISNEKESLFRSLFDPEEHVVKGFIHFIGMLRNKGIPMVIGSAAPPENIEYVVSTLGIADYFEGVVHEDHVEAGKPHPDVFSKSAKVLGRPIGNCIVFEDSVSGAEAAENAGANTIVVLTTKSKSDFRDVGCILGFTKHYKELMENGLD